MLVIGIVGASFCGSTIISRLLGSARGVAAPGEVHWLLDAARVRQGLRFDGDAKLCFRCGPECPVLPVSLLDRVTPENAYDVMSEVHGGVRVVVSSDKSLEQYARYARWPDLLLFLLRRPETHVPSFARTVSSELEALKILTDFYCHQIEWARGLGLVSKWARLEDILAVPELLFSWLNELTEGLVPSTPPSLLKEYHHIWGNLEAVSSPVVDRRIPERRVLSQIRPDLVRSAYAPVYAALENNRFERLGDDLCEP